MTERLMEMISRIIDNNLDDYSSGIELCPERRADCIKNFGCTTKCPAALTAQTTFNSRKGVSNGGKSLEIKGGFVYWSI